MGILSGNPKEEPMHYGEVFGAWTFLATAKGCVASHQTLLNHAGDGDLRKLIEETIEQSKREITQVEELLKENGVGLPPTPPERSKVNIEDIPVGARFQDPEIATSISMDMAAGLIACSNMIAQSVREDVAGMFEEFHTEHAAMGARFLNLNKKKGWLVPPPLHYNKSE